MTHQPVKKLKSVQPQETKGRTTSDLNSVHLHLPIITVGIKTQHNCSRSTSWPRVWTPAIRWREWWTSWGEWWSEPLQKRGYPRRYPCTGTWTACFGPSRPPTNDGKRNAKQQAGRWTSTAKRYTSIKKAHIASGMEGTFRNPCFDPSRRPRIERKDQAPHRQAGTLTPTAKWCTSPANIYTPTVNGTHTG